MYFRLKVGGSALAWDKLMSAQQLHRCNLIENLTAADRHAACLGFPIRMILPSSVSV